jgi:hypothetical protein
MRNSLLKVSVSCAFRELFQTPSLVVVQVAGGPALSLLRDEELELLVCGLPHLDFDALEAAARYEGGFSADHPTMRQFWRTVKALPLEKKRRLLAFATGSDRCVPALGYKIGGYWPGTLMKCTMKRALTDVLFRGHRGRFTQSGQNVAFDCAVVLKGTPAARASPKTLHEWPGMPQHQANQCACCW